MNLVKKTLHGIGWVAFFTGTTRVVRFLTTLILARLLEPEDFGIIAIGLLVVNVIAMFRDMGFGSALIYYKGDVEKAANTAFTLFPLIGSALYLSAYLVAPWVAVFFETPEVEPVVRFLSLSVLIVSLGLTHANLLDKELEFKKHVIPEVGSIVSYGIIAVMLAYADFGVWSIVYGKVLSSLIWLILLWLVFPWRPRREFDLGIAKNLFTYGRHVMGSMVIFFLLTNIDNAFVGKFLGTVALGFYAIAFNVSNMPSMSLTQLANRVMFPMYSKLQDDVPALIRVYLKTLKYVSLISIPLSLGILLLAPELIRFVLGEKWLPALVPLQVLCVAALFRSIAAITSVLFKAVGKPDILEKLSLYQLLLLMLVIYPMSMRYGVLGTSLSISILTVAFTVVGLKVANDILGIGFGRIFHVVWAPVLATLAMGGGVWLLRSIFAFSGLFGFIGLAAAMIILYVGALLAADRELLSGLRELKTMMRST